MTEAGGLFRGICSDCAGRRILCAFESLLLRAGNYAPAENNFGNLCGYDCGCGCSGTGGSHKEGNSRSAFSYLILMAFMAAGFVLWTLIGLHQGKRGVEHDG